MITKEELLVAFEESTRTLELNNQIFGLALKGLESESTVKRLIQARDQWRKKHDDLADELDDKIIALEIQTDHLRNGRLQAENQIAVLEDKLRDTVSLKYHDELISSASRRVNALLRERVDLVSEIKNWGETDRAKNADIDALQRVVGEMHAENNCMRADLENMCKELSVLKIENKKWEEKLKDKDDDWRLSVSYYMNLAAAWEKQAKALKAKLKKFEDFFAGED